LQVGSGWLWGTWSSWKMQQQISALYKFRKALERKYKIGYHTKSETIYHLIQQNSNFSNSLS
jgi:hypothetical protein